MKTLWGIPLLALYGTVLAQSAKLGSAADVQTAVQTAGLLCAREIRSLSVKPEQVRFKPVSVNPPSDKLAGNAVFDVAGLFPGAFPAAEPPIQSRLRVSCRLVYVDGISLKMKVDGIEVESAD